MRQNRSADPWSTFLSPSGRGGATAPRMAAPFASPPPAAPGHPPGRGDDLDSDDACRRVLDRLNAARGPLTLEQIHRATRLGLLVVADAVETLRDRGLVSVEHELDEVVRLTGGAGPAA
ncbi:MULTISPECIES: hypothetical protein [Thermomonosporaceae]|uniref:hypothetical protein n=1 Tax=Thermomonosporaceae TaxID=2012 RepID=UPI00255AE264|nr:MULTISPECIES: hypothetical protein [Thermomonosporaceae]MDL4771260.1 hypothetical protein [Actinomadura xylanilytica]